MPVVWILKFGNQQIHACFHSKKIRQAERTREKQKVPIFSTCFHSLKYFETYIKRVFLKLDIMFNIFQFEFSKVEFVWCLIHAWTFPYFCPFQHLVFYLNWAEIWIFWILLRDRSWSACFCWNWFEFRGGVMS